MCLRVCSALYGPVCPVFFFSLLICTSSYHEDTLRPEPVKMAYFTRAHLAVACVVILSVIFFYYNFAFLDFCAKTTPEVPTVLKSWLPPAQTGPCTCASGSTLLKDHIPKANYEDVVQRRTKELQHHKIRTNSVLTKLLLASPNSPLQYPIQGFTVRPLTSTLITGLALQTGARSTYEVTLNVSKGVLLTMSTEGVKIKGNGETTLTVQSNNLLFLNTLLSNVFYKSTVYHVNTGDLVTFQFENHKAVFPVVIKQPQVPVLYDMGTDINSSVTITTKTFLRYEQLQVLLKSIRTFYSHIRIIIADDSFEPQKISGENILHYIMPPAKGWFAGRNLAVSQVTTKYFLWVDDDFEFTKETKIEQLVEVMEAVPELDVLGGTVQGNQFYFSIIYEEGDDTEGGCLNRKSRGKYQPLPGYPQCTMVDGVVNFFLARTDAVQRVGFDPKLQRVAHSEFFMDGLGSLMVASCNHVTVGHQPKRGQSRVYSKYRHPARSDVNFKYQLHFFKNNLKCIHFG